MAVEPRVLEAAGLPEPGRLSRLREWWEQEHVFGYGLIVPAARAARHASSPSRSGWRSTSACPTTGSARPAASWGSRTTGTSSATRPSGRPSRTPSSSRASRSTCKIVLGVWLAMLLARNLPFKRVIRGVVLLPFVIPDRAVDAGVALDVRLALQRRQLDGHPAAPDQRARAPTGSGSPTYAMAAVIAVNVWRGLPFFAITVLAGLMAVPARVPTRPPRWTARARGDASGT